MTNRPSTHFEKEAYTILADIQKLKKKIHVFSDSTIKHYGPLDSNDPYWQGEMVMNSTQAYRELENCEFRIGKTLQAYYGGNSPDEKINI